MLRFAPSPTGDMHIGNLRAAIFNYIIALQKKDTFLLRIEDTDIERNIEGKEKDIMFLLTLFGIKWDKFIFQSENFPKHRQLAEYLISKNKAFYCYCTKGFLDKKREEAKEQKRAFRYDDSWAELEKDTNKNPVIRLRGASSDISFKDSIKGELTFKNDEIDSFVIIKENGIPTYNFACAIDDMLFDIDCIIRGEDHVSNTPKQILVHRGLDYNKDIEFAHLPIILNDEGKKMSKRDSASSVQWLLDSGYLPQAILNYLVLLGNKTPCEVFTLKECVKWFRLENVAKAPAKFDINKLKFLNREHFKLLNEQDLAVLLGYKDSSIGALAKIYLQEASTLNELRDKIDRIFAKKSLIIQDEFKAEFGDEVLILQQEILSLENVEKLSYDEFKDILIKATNLKGKKFFKPLRFLLSGSDHGPEICDLFAVVKYYLKDIVRI